MMDWQFVGVLANPVTSINPLIFFKGNQVMRKYSLGKSSLCISKTNSYAWFRRGEVALNVVLSLKPRITLVTPRKVFDLGWVRAINGTRFVCKSTQLVEGA